MSPQYVFICQAYLRNRTKRRFNTKFQGFLFIVKSCLGNRSGMKFNNWSGYNLCLQAKDLFPIELKPNGTMKSPQYVFICQAYLRISANVDIMSCK